VDIGKDEVMVITTALVEAEGMEIAEVGGALGIGVSVELTEAMVEIEVNGIDMAKDKVMETEDEVAITSLFNIQFVNLFVLTYQPPFYLNY
jgi:hypothetical protein